MNFDYFHHPGWLRMLPTSGRAWRAVLKGAVKGLWCWGFGHLPKLDRDKDEAVILTCDRCCQTFAVAKPTQLTMMQKKGES